MEDAGGGRNGEGRAWRRGRDCDGSLAAERNIDGRERVGEGHYQEDGRSGGEGGGWGQAEQAPKESFVGAVLSALPAICKLGKAGASLMSSPSAFTNSPPPVPPSQPAAFSHTARPSPAPAPPSAHVVGGRAMEHAQGGGVGGGGGGFLGLGVGLVNLGLGLFRSLSLPLSLTCTHTSHPISLSRTHSNTHTLSLSI